MNFSLNDIIEAIAFIPARYDSSRLPGKLLADICGKPLIQHVWEGVCGSSLIRRVVIATDNEKIADKCFDLGAEYMLTPANIDNGTQRIIYAYQMLEETSPFIINIQGDEPFINGEIIDNLIIEFAQSEAEVGTLVKKIDNNEDLFNPSVVKVAIKSDKTANYFSRSPIPFVRDVEKDKWLEVQTFWKHIGIYIYRANFFQQIQQINSTELESAEKLEQLKFLDYGAKILCIETKENLIGVDTQEDLELVRKMKSNHVYA